MQLSAQNISKRFDSGWIIRDFNLDLESGDRLAIKGANGSGKSTLISILAGYLSPSKGKILYNLNADKISRENVYKYLAISTAYTELDEEMNAQEIFNHYRVFKSFLVDDVSRFLDLAELSKHRNKPVKFYSSGMKQRLSLAMAITMDVPLLLLDEPGSFLDNERKAWYLELLQSYGRNKTIITASNDPDDFWSCNKEIVMTSA